jgi:hypothetical protein
MAAPFLEYVPTSFQRERETLSPYTYSFLRVKFSGGGFMFPLLYVLEEKRAKQMVAFDVLFIFSCFIIHAPNTPPLPPLRVCVNLQLTSKLQ